jgi:3-phosphoshikimate 1-carboxyvinyltransferase
VVTLPGSKSLTNRALVIGALADGQSRLDRCLFADDTRAMLTALAALGFRVQADETTECVLIDGLGGRIPATRADLDAAASGTTMRFLTAMLTLGAGRYRLHGTQRMHERPIGDLLDALGRLGAHVRSESQDGCPPVLIKAEGLAGGACTIRGAVSSQFLSALLMAAPYAESDVSIQVAGELVSRPYVEMTCRVMDDFDVEVVQTADLGRFEVAAGQVYQSRQYAIEPDASGAGYFLAAAAVAGGRVRVEGLGTGSVQGDVGFVDVLEQMGCRIGRGAAFLEVRRAPSAVLAGVDVDLGAMPDMAQTLAAVALFAKGPTTIRGVANLRVKETDRIAALATELTRLGAKVDVLDDGLRIHPPARIMPAGIQTYDDHRMAMSFAVVGLGAEGVTLRDVECVGKTFPDFFDRLDRLSRR